MAGARWRPCLAVAIIEGGGAWLTVLTQHQHTHRRRKREGSEQGRRRPTTPPFLPSFFLKKTYLSCRLVAAGAGPDDDGRGVGRARGVRVCIVSLARRPHAPTHLSSSSVTRAAFVCTPPSTPRPFSPWDFCPCADIFFFSPPSPAFVCPCVYPACGVPPAPFCPDKPVLPYPPSTHTLDPPILRAGAPGCPHTHPPSPALLSRLLFVACFCLFVSRHTRTHTPPRPVATFNPTPLFWPLFAPHTHRPPEARLARHIFCLLFPPHPWTPFKKKYAPTRAYHTLLFPSVPNLWQGVAAPPPAHAAPRRACCRLASFSPLIK